jgi:ribose-phosphate pyrophosphokinase
MIKVNGFEIQKEYFPDNTLRLLNFDENVINWPLNQEIDITWLYEGDYEISMLLFLTKHIKETFETYSKIKLILPYVPNARMDRTKSDCEVFTLKYFCDFINYLDFDRVEIFDPHSDVTPALIKNVKVITPNKMIGDVLDEIEYTNDTPIYKGTTIIYFPDAGAMKRYKDMPRLKGYEIIYGEKDRDWRTGKIVGLKVFNQKGERIDDMEGYLEGQSVLMIDDIISYGGTLAYSADALKAIGASHIYIYASHVENSISDGTINKVKERLDNETITEVFTTNSLFDTKKYEFPNITIIYKF